MVLASNSILEQQSLLQDAFTRNLSSLVALVILVLEFFHGLANECRGKINQVKSIYIFSRYFGLCAQIVNIIVVFFTLSEIPSSPARCKAWFSYLSICSCSLLLAIDVALILRVHILYNRSRKVLLFLFCLVTIQGGLVTKCSAQKIRVVPFNGICDVQETPVEVVYFMASTIITQITLLFMTVAKRKVAFGQSPVIDLVIRDGTWVFVLIVAMVGTTIPYSLFVQVSKPHIVLVWPITILSVACCRLILNMQKIGYRTDDGYIETDADQSNNQGIAFTSLIGIEIRRGSPTAGVHVNATRRTNLHSNHSTSESELFYTNTCPTASI